MTLARETTCPRCGQAITFRKDGMTIYPHRDELVGAPCPMGGVEISYARRQVEEQRRQIACLISRWSDGPMGPFTTRRAIYSLAGHGKAATGAGMGKGGGAKL